MSAMRDMLLIVLGMLMFSSCSLSQDLLRDTSEQPQYHQLHYWAAHKNIEDPTDTSFSGVFLSQGEPEAPTFFVHPTIYFPKSGESWNAPIEDEEFINRVRNTPVAYQASVFNAAGPVYAPLYRQAAYQVYQGKSNIQAKREAYELAYGDVKAAFDEFLSEIGHQQPFFLASHSQGTDHLKHLLEEEFDDSLKKRLVAAYLVGMAVDTCKLSIPVCETPDQTGCFVSWRTWRYGAKGRGQLDSCVAVTNPLSWTTDQVYVPRSENHGALLSTEKPMKKYVSSAQVNGPLLFTHRPKFPGSIFILTKNYHRGDINLYYRSIAENQLLRWRSFPQ